MLKADMLLPGLDLNLRWPFFRLPPTKRTFLAFFFLRFFFFFFAFFFFFFFLALGFLAFLAFFALGFFAAFFAGFFFAAVACVRARLFVIAFFTTVVSVATTASSSTKVIVSESNALPLSQ